MGEAERTVGTAVGEALGAVVGAITLWFLLTLPKEAAEGADHEKAARLLP